MSILSLVKVAIMADEAVRDTMGIVTREFPLYNRSDDGLSWRIKEKCLHWIDANNKDTGPEWEVEERWDKDGIVALQVYDGRSVNLIMFLCKDKERLDGQG
jgi:hypothetical protein